MADDIYNYFLQNNPHKPVDNGPSVRSRSYSGRASQPSYPRRDVYAQDDANSYNFTSVALDRVLYEDEDNVVSDNYSAAYNTMKKASVKPRQSAPKKRASVIKVTLIAVSGLLMISTVLYGKVQTNRMYRQISDKNAAYEDVQSENVRLKSELEGKMTLKNVEDYAVNVLGLQKLDNSQIKYVQTQTDDKVEILEEDKGILAAVKEKFSAIIEYIFG